ncbi:hypothetical protein E2C01_064145 [Portunus trituberculatus]|uniref:Uncharacterized protein n=1 Tax=Portunus trituberculatus TaxID=210409 RepID=A0A5B7HFH6_PORTR|nr:hypothetical protein [Portunus trituberculatus]
MQFTSPSPPHPVHLMSSPPHHTPAQSVHPS